MKSRQNYVAIQFARQIFCREQFAVLTIKRQAAVAAKGRVVDGNCKNESYQRLLDKR